MRRGGDSYYVLVNKEDEEYTVDDIIEGEMILDFNTWKEAEDYLKQLLDEGDVEETDGWHVERLM